jgi:hypothetical protein
MLTVRVESNRDGSIASHARKMIAQMIERDTGSPMIPSLHRAVFPCTCAYCRVTFWSGNQYDSVCADRMCVRASRCDDE